MAEIDEIVREALGALRPPPKLRLSDWIHETLNLPSGVSAQPGPVKLWPFQVDIADAIGDPAIERVTLVKPVRVGFTTLLTAAVASYVANDPAPILCLLPTEADCRDYVVSDIEPIFAASEAVSRVLMDDREEGERNTILSRRFPGGSLKVVAAKSPRNLRRHNVRVLFIDEADAMDATAEGSPILLAERRTLSFPDRKIVLGSTPVHEDTSHVLRAWAQSDQRVFEISCPACGAWTEMMWDQIRWPDGRPEEAEWCCPSCGVLADEDQKPGMVTGGRWRATAPEVKGHAGFRLNALVSLHENASWGRLAREFVDAKADPSTLQTFVNTILGQGWRGEGDEVSEGDLAARAMKFGMDDVPDEVLAITVGVDVQHDRIEATLVGWDEPGCAWVLGHRVIWGQWTDAEPWALLADLLKSDFPHRLGGRIGIDAAAVDAGDGTTMKKVVDFCRPLARRRVLAIKGAPGSRVLIERASSSRAGNAGLWIVGVDTAKQQVFGRLTRPEAMKFSADLPQVWYEQATAERSILRYRRGQPTRSFERIPGRRAEALDCLVYALAVRSVVSADWVARRDALMHGRPVQAAAPSRAARPVAKAGDWIETREDWI